MKVTLLGFTVPPKTLEYISGHDRVMPAQTYRFGWALVRALRDNGVDVRLLSTAPVSDYPGNARAVWGRQRFEVDGVVGLMMPFINLLLLKHLTRYLSCWVFGMRDLRASRPDWIAVHGVHSPFLWFALAAARRVEARVVIVLTDPPGVIRSDEGRFKSLLKQADIGVVRKALRRADAVVVLAEPLAHDFAAGIPSLVMEGLYDASAVPDREHIDPTRVRSVVYAGGLHEGYGVKNLVTAFRSIPDIDLRLEIYGNGPLKEWLAEQAAADHRIQPPRLVPPQELPEIYTRATVLVQPRQVDQDFVPYSFPSKLIEYMAAGTVVVSTRLPSIPSAYEPFVVWSDDDVSGLRASVASVLARTPEDRLAFGERAATFVRQSRSTQAQGARIVKFLSKI